MRFYGFTGGHGSYAQVLRGFQEAFLPKKIATYAVDDGRHRHSTVAANHKVGVFLGPPVTARVMLASGHATRFVMVAPNSTWLPDELVRLLEEVATEILVPSEWAREILLKYTSRPVMTVQHGVLSGFRHSPVLEESVQKTYGRGAFDVAHFSSTGRQRKGTRELILAWRLLRKRGALPPLARLFIVIPSDEGLTVQLDVGPSEDIAYRDRLNFPPEQLSQIYSECHVVCQPSRGEAFGMVPLEALASGTPVIASRCTGHEQWMTGLGVDHGVVSVRMGALEPIDDGPGALAPALDVEALANALDYASRHFLALKEAALSSAAAIRERHSWKRQLAEFQLRIDKE